MRPFRCESYDWKPLTSKPWEFVTQFITPTVRDNYYKPLQCTKKIASMMNGYLFYP